MDVVWRKQHLEATIQLLGGGGGVEFLKIFNIYSIFFQVPLNIYLQNALQTIGPIYFMFYLMWSENVSPPPNNWMVTT